MFKDNNHVFGINNRGIIVKIGRHNTNFINRVGIIPHLIQTSFSNFGSSTKRQRKGSREDRGGRQIDGGAQADPQRRSRYGLRAFVPFFPRRRSFRSLRRCSPRSDPLLARGPRSSPFRSLFPPPSVLPFSPAAAVPSTAAPSLPSCQGRANKIRGPVLNAKIGLPLNSKIGPSRLPLINSKIGPSRHPPAQDEAST